VVDIVDIGLRVDSSTVKSGERALDDFSKQAEKSQRETDKFNSVSSALTATFKGLAIATTAIAASIGAAYAIMRPFAEAQAEAEQSAARLNAVLRATGHAAGLSARQINGMAEALAATTQFDDESIRNASAVMATFRNVQSSTFREGVELAADLSALLGGDLQSAVMQVGKALNEPEQGITALSRAGIQFSEVQKQQIKLFVETNQLGKAQAIVIQEMRNQFGGTAQAMNTGITKSIKDMDKAWNELQEEIGISVGPMFTSIVNGATAAANAMRQLISSANGTATDARGGNWLETQTARINAMAGEISKAEADLASKRDNPLAFWLPSESDLRARIEAIKTVIVAESRALNQQVIAAGGRPITDDDRAASAGAASERRWAAEQSASQLAAAREEARKRSDLRPDVVEGEFGPDESQFAQAISRQKERHEAETQLWAQNEADKSRLLQEGIDQRIAQEQAAAQIIQQTQSATFSAVGNLFGVFAAKSKAAALAQLAITKGYAIFEILARSKVAAAMAIGPPLGPVAGAPLAASITAWGVANAAAVGASGIAGAIQINQGNFGAGSSTTGGSGVGGSTTGTTKPTATEAAAPVNRGVTQFTIVANNNGIAYLDYASIIILGEKMREASLRGDLIILDPQSRNAQDIAAQSIVQAA